jgi:Protein RETICULATA-related
MSNGLIALRSRLDKNFKSQNKPPNVVLNAGTWAAHMGISSNLRYQMINGLDMVRIYVWIGTSAIPIPAICPCCTHCVSGLPTCMA